MEILHLYRPLAPSMRAQDVQVVHTAHALAARGHRVTLLADRADKVPPSTEGLLAAWGLAPLPTLDLRLSPTRWPPAAGLWFRAQLLDWSRRVGREAFVYAREAKYLPPVPARIPAIYEAHACEALVAEDAGAAVGPAEALERATLARATGLVANCGGTLAAMEERYGSLAIPTRVIHNATAPGRALVRRPLGEPTVIYAGSPRLWKGLATVMASARKWPAPLRLLLVGGAPAGVELPANTSVLPPQPYDSLPEVLAGAHALLLPLDDNLFGRRLTSPLKLWDYLATGIPIVAADLPTVREIAEDIPHYYHPGDPESLGAAVARALAAGTSPSRLRTWADRSAEILDFASSVLGFAA